MPIRFFFLGYRGTGIANISGGATLALGLYNYIGANGGAGTLTISGAGSNCTVPKVSGAPNALDIGTDGTLTGIKGSVELDHGASLEVGINTNNSNAALTGTINLSSVGTLQILSGSLVTAGTLSEVPGSTLEIGLDGPNSTENGQLNLTTAAVAGALDIVLENGFVPTYGEQFDLFPFTKINGQFSAINLPAGYAWDTSDLYLQGIISVGPVPEPAAMTAIATLAVAGLRRRRRVAPRI